MLTTKEPESFLPQAANTVNIHPEQAYIIG
jgi:hypothetical protein